MIVRRKVLAVYVRVIVRRKVLAVYVVVIVRRKVLAVYVVVIVRRKMLAMYVMVIVRRKVLAVYVVHCLCFGESWLCLSLCWRCVHRSSDIPSRNSACRWCPGVSRLAFTKHRCRTRSW